MMQCVATQTHLAADAAGAPIEPALNRVLDRDSGPVTLMLHGFRYCPLHQPNANDPTVRDPHRLIYAQRPETDCTRTISWPQLLQRSGPTLGIAWPAMYQGNGTLAVMRGFPAVYERAGLVARQVARLADRITELDPTRRIDIIGHSLGARVALSALTHMKTAEPGQVLLWGAAERANVAQQLIAQAPSATSITNVRTRTNARYDAMFEWAAPGRGPALGSARPIEGVRTLTLDDPITEHALAQRGHTLGPAPRGKCHWSFYTRAGTGPLYSELLDRPGIWTAERVAALAQPQQRQSSGWMTTLSSYLPVNRMRGA